MKKLLSWMYSSATRCIESQPEYTRRRSCFMCRRYFGWSRSLLVETVIKSKQATKNYSVANRKKSHVSYMLLSALLSRKLVFSFFGLVYSCVSKYHSKFSTMPNRNPLLLKPQAACLHLNFFLWSLPMNFHCWHNCDTCWELWKNCPTRLNAIGWFYLQRTLN